MKDDRNPLFDPLEFEHKQVLEVGPGDGAFTVRYLPAAASVVCIEPDATIFKTLQENWQTAGHSATLSLLNGRFEETPLPTEAFDFVIFAHSF